MYNPPILLEGVRAGCAVSIPTHACCSSIRGPTYRIRSSRKSSDLACAARQRASATSPRSGCRTCTGPRLSWSRSRRATARPGASGRRSRAGARSSPRIFNGRATSSRRPALRRSSRSSPRRRLCDRPHPRRRSSREYDGGAGACTGAGEARSDCVCGADRRALQRGRLEIQMSTVRRHLGAGAALSVFVQGGPLGLRLPSASSLRGRSGRPGTATLHSSSRSLGSRQWSSR